MEPRRRKRRDLQGFEGNGAQHPVEMGGPQRVQDGPSPVSIEGGTCELRLQQRYHAALFPPLPHLRESLMPIENGAHQSCDATPTREPMRRMGRDEAVNPRGHLETP